MSCRDKWQSKLNINMKCFNIAVLPSGKLFSKNCGEKILYRPSAIFSLNWQVVFCEYFARKNMFWKNGFIMFIRPHGPTLDQIWTSNYDLVECGLRNENGTQYTNYQINGLLKIKFTQR